MSAYSFLAKLGEIEVEKRQLDKRLNFLLEDDDPEMAQSFRDEYRRQFLALKNDERVLIGRKMQLQLLQKQLAEKQDTGKKQVARAHQQGYQLHQEKRLGSRSNQPTGSYSRKSSFGRWS